MSETSVLPASSLGDVRPERSGGGWWRKEDWWAVLIGLGLVAVGYILFANGQSLAWLAATPAKWTTLAELGKDFAGKAPRYLALGALWLALSGAALGALGRRLASALPAVLLLFLAALLVFTLAQWAPAQRLNLEPPLVALGLGLVLANLRVLPRSLDEGFRVEFFIKLGVVLLGATLPFTLILWAGPVALLQAGIVSLVTFGAIFGAARLLKIDPRTAAVLGVGGAVCGVSAAIAVSAAVGARKEATAQTISIVIVWAIVMIFLLPFLAAGLHLPAGVGGAWIGTSEFADAAGLAAAQSFGGILAKAPGAGGGAVEQSVAAFTLMKVVGRDVWIGVWAILLSLVATARWDVEGLKPGERAGEVWRRFPKFVLGFLLASLLVTLIASGLGRAGFGKVADPGFVTPIKNLRTWAFALGFLAIGLTTRFGELRGVFGRPFAAFSAGVVVNVVLGLLLSALVFGGYWAGLKP